MKKFLIALMLGAFSMSAFAAHHNGHGKDKHKAQVHKKHKPHKKAKAAGQ